MPNPNNKKRPSSALLGRRAEQQQQHAIVTKSEDKGKQNVKPSIGDNSRTEDWLEKLVQQSSSGKDTKILSKEDRIRKRLVKKARREQSCLEQKHKQQETVRGMTRAFYKDDTMATKVQNLTKLSKRRLQLIASSIDKVRKDLYGNKEIRPRLYDTKVATKTMAAGGTKKRKRQWNEISIQPRPSDYSGIGLARKSLYIEFLDPSCLARLEEEFHEHIPGFFGKQWTKAMKRQTNGTMLWRQLVNNKHQLSNKLKSMNPDQRVQAMIDAGMI